MQASSQAAFVEAQNKANRDAYDISKKARESEIARQQQFENEAASYWDQTADSLGAEDHDEKRAEAEQDFVKAFEERPTSQPEGQLLSGQDSANETIKTEIASRANTAAADARRRVEALAKLSAYGTAGNDRAALLGTTSDKLATLNGIRRGSLGVSGQEQNISPAQVSQGGSGVADILSGVGGIVSGFGGGKRVPYSPAASSAISRGVPGLY